MPEPTKVPPQLLVYHFKVVPEPPVAVRLISPPASEQKLFTSVEADVGATGAGSTVTVTLAQVELPQAAVSQRA